MRDILFKNFTSSDRKRRVIASSEIVDKAGIRTTVRRHFVCIARERISPEIQKQQGLLVVKEHNTKLKFERFYCQLKGTVTTNISGKPCHILYMHSLKIVIASIPEALMKYTADS